MGTKSRFQPSGTRLYRIWSNMNDRCRRSNAPWYEKYGGKGVKVCAEWAESFKAFEDWAYANGYREYLAIDRIDNNGDYTPDNCRWATQLEQMRNTSKTTFCTINGVTKSISEWAEHAELKACTVYDRFRKGDQGEDIIRPIGSRPKQVCPRIMIKIGNETKSVREWSEVSGISLSTIHYRYRKGDRGEALIRPSRNKYKSQRHTRKSKALTL